MVQPRYRTLLVLGLSLAIGATFFFGYRAGRTARHIHWRNEPIQPWMSVPFIAHTHHMRAEILFRAIGVQPNPRDRRSIREIARAERVPAAGLIRELQNAIANADRPRSEAIPPPAKAP